LPRGLEEVAVCGRRRRKYLIFGGTDGAIRECGSKWSEEKGERKGDNI
jgi:hypothetical protein